jgi:kynurenine formamidase
MDESFPRLFEVIGFLLVNALTRLDADQNKHPCGCGRGVFRGKFFSAQRQRTVALANPTNSGQQTMPALKYLYEERKITATTKDDYSLETYILSTNHYQIELLSNLDQVPEPGAIVVVSFPKPKGGSGFPARVFAILP